MRFKFTTNGQIARELDKYLTSFMSLTENLVNQWLYSRAAIIGTRSLHTVHSLFECGMAGQLRHVITGFTVSSLGLIPDGVGLTRSPLLIVPVE